MHNREGLLTLPCLFSQIAIFIPITKRFQLTICNHLIIMVFGKSRIVWIFAFVNPKAEEPPFERKEFCHDL